MTKLIQLILLLWVFTLASCVSTNQPSQISHSEHHAIVDVLPKEIEGFAFNSTSTFPEPWGYSLTYVFERGFKSKSDVYIFPVPADLIGQNKADIVNTMTRAAIAEIEYYRDQGSYSDYELLRVEGIEIAGSYATRVEFYLVRDNLASFSLLFLTESHGKLLKVRMTMPDNPANRNNERWQRFAVQVFEAIIANIGIA